MITRVIDAMFEVWEKYNARDKIKFFTPVLKPKSNLLNCSTGLSTDS